MSCVPCVVTNVRRFVPSPKYYQIDPRGYLRALTVDLFLFFPSTVSFFLLRSCTLAHYSPLVALASACRDPAFIWMPRMRAGCAQTITTRYLHTALRGPSRDTSAMYSHTLRGDHRDPLAHTKWRQMSHVVSISHYIHT